MCRFWNHESAMKREKYGKYENEIDRDTDNNNRKSKWQESSFTPECLIPKKEYR
jgi:hypothetical protein